jgi:hypothetical protein
LAALNQGIAFQDSPIALDFRPQQISGMGKPLFYREIQFSGLGSPLPEKVGSFVVGIPTRALEEYRKEHPKEGTDAAFRNLLSKTEI